MKKAFEKMSDGQKLFATGLIGGTFLTICFTGVMSAIKSFGKLVKAIVDVFKNLK